MAAVCNKVAPLSSVCALMGIVKSYEGQVIDAEKIRKMSIAVESAFQEIAQQKQEEISADLCFVEMIDTNVKLLNIKSVYDKFLPYGCSDNAKLLTAKKPNECISIGEGGFAKVHRLKIAENAFIALKTVCPSEEERALEEHAREIKIFLSIPRNQHVIEFLGVDASKGMMLAYAAGGSFLDWINENPINERNVITMIKEIALDITAGVAYLHKRHIVHRDLKCDNVLLARSPCVGLKNSAKIGDFGLAVLLTPDEWANPPLAAVLRVTGFTAPEYFSAMFCKKDRYIAPVARSADIWSLGHIIYAACTRENFAEAPPMVQYRFSKGDFTREQDFLILKINQFSQWLKWQMPSQNERDDVDVITHLMHTTLVMDSKKRKNAQELIEDIAQKGLRNFDCIKN